MTKYRTLLNEFLKSWNERARHGRISTLKSEEVMVLEAFAAWLDSNKGKKK